MHGLIKLNKIYSSNPKRTRIAKERDQPAPEVQRHDFVGRPNQLPSDEHDRHRRVSPHELSQSFLHLSPTRSLVELMDGSIDAEVMEEALHGVAHTTRAQTKYDDRPLRRQLHHIVHCYEQQ